MCIRMYIPRSVHDHTGCAVVTAVHTVAGTGGVGPPVAGRVRLAAAVQHGGGPQQAGPLLVLVQRARQPAVVAALFPQGRVDEHGAWFQPFQRASPGGVRELGAAARAICATKGSVVVLTTRARITNGDHNLPPAIKIFVRTRGSRRVINRVRNLAGQRSALSPRASRAPISTMRALTRTPVPRVRLSQERDRL